MEAKIKFTVEKKKEKTRKKKGKRQWIIFTKTYLTSDIFCCFYSHSCATLFITYYLTIYTAKSTHPFFI